MVAVSCLLVELMKLNIKIKNVFFETPLPFNLIPTLPNFILQQV